MVRHGQKNDGMFWLILVNMHYCEVTALISLLTLDILVWWLGLAVRKGNSWVQLC